MKREGGFTLVEVMLTAVLLTLGTLLLHQSYLRLADLYGRYVNDMRLQGWVADQMWQAREAVVYSSQPVEDLPAGGTVEIGPKSFQWRREVRSIPGRGLYSIRMDVSWLEGNRPAGLSREVYAMHREIV